MILQKPELHAQDVGSDEINLGDLLATLTTGKWTIAATVVSTFVLAASYLWLTPPTFEANALLQIQEGQNTLALPSSVGELLGNEDSSALAELEIIRSRQVLGRAAAELKLEWVAEPVRAPIIGQAMATRDLPWPELSILSPYARKGDTITLSYLEVPPEWLGQELLVEKTSADGYAITLPDQARMEGKVGVLLSDKDRGIAIQIARLDGAVGRVYLVTHLPELGAIARLSKRLSVSERGRQTSIVAVSLRGEDRIKTAAQLNAIIRAYAEQNVMQSAAEARKGLQFVESQIPASEAAVGAAEKALNDYRAAQNSVDLEFETQSLLTETTGIEAQLREIALQEEELKEKYTPNHPAYRQLLDQRSALQTRLSELQAGITNLPETQREVVNLTRNLELAQASYVELINRAQELRVLSASQIGSVRIVDDAATMLEPVAPRRVPVLALAGVLGVLMGIGIVLLRNWLRRGIDSVTEIERLGLPVFATVNSYNGPIKASSGGRLPLLAREDPDDIVIEALRSLRTSLHFGMLDAPSKSIVLTSAAPGAGKSFLSANLACVAAQAGQKVCLIDADMRRGTQRLYFGLPKKALGLADYLSDSASLDQVLIASGVENLSLLVTGAFPPNPSELLMRDRLAELIAILDRHFDLVIIDAPPMLAVTDAAILGRKAGSVIGVARHLVTPADELEAVRKTLETAGVALKGIVFNGYDPRRAKSGRRGYGYGYGYGYANRYTYKRSGQND
jgi:tyrosine-protein kinase Etk/Wzc